MKFRRGASAGRQAGELSGIRSTSPAASDYFLGGRQPLRRIGEPEAAAARSIMEAAMGESRVTFTVGVSKSGLPAVYRTEVRMVEECASTEAAKRALEQWADVSAKIASEMVARGQS